MQALEVSHFGGVASFHQSFVTHLDEFDGAAAQNSLFAEQVGFCFFFEVGFNDAGLAATVGHGVAQCQRTGFAALVLVHSHQVGHAAALCVSVANGVAWGLRGHHPNVEVFTGHHLVVVNVEAVGKSQ